MSNEASYGNYEKFTLRIAANFPNPPYFYTTMKENKTLVINGIDYHLINTLVKYLRVNISYEFIHGNWLWGKKVNGSWDGIIGQIVNNSADIALGALSSTPEREKVVDFTIPYYYSDITFFTRLTKLSSINTQSLLLEPFSKVVWFCLILTVILSSILLKLFNQSFEKTFWIMIRALLQKAIQPKIPRSLRLFAITWLVFGLILSTTYVAFIFLFMSELIPRPGITSIEELAIAVKNGQYIPATSGGGSLFKQIKEVKSPPLNFIGESLIDINQVNKAMLYMLTNMSKLSYICPRLLINGRAKRLVSITQYIQLTKYSLTPIMATRIMANPDYSNQFLEPRLLAIIGVRLFGPELFNLPPKNDETTFVMEQLTIALPKNFKFKNQINKLIRSLESSAHLFHWERVSLREKSNINNRTIDVNKEEEPTKGLALSTVKYIFYLLSFGLIFALFVLMSEMIANDCDFKQIQTEVLLVSESFSNQKIK